MTDTLAVRTRPIDPEQLADNEKFEQMLVRYLAGDLDEDVFRVFRLGNGIYGQRQGGQNQMVRVKVPYGSIEPEQLEMIGWLVDASRQLATVAIADAAATPGVDAKKLTDARALLADGDSRATSGQYQNAIDRYGAAWQKANDAAGKK